MFQESWNLNFYEWDWGDWTPSQDTFGTLKETRTFSYSDDDDSSECDEDMINDEYVPNDEINRSPIRWILNWFQGQGRVQKFIYYVGGLGVLLIMLASGLVLHNNMSNVNANSASDSDHGFVFPDDFYAVTSSPSVRNIEGQDISKVQTQMPLDTPAVPTLNPNILNSPSPTPPSSSLTYMPGNLTTLKFGVMLSEGLDTRIIAFSNERVNYYGNGHSKDRFHGLPDAGATFPDEREGNSGGWIYVSNSEIENKKGGVGAITFDKSGNVIDYQVLLKGTSMNCGGGRTPWKTWVRTN